MVFQIEIGEKSVM